MNLEWLTSGRALILSAATGGPSVLWAAVNDEWLPVAVGVAVGVLAFLLSVYRSSNDSRFETILARLDKAEKEADDYRAESVRAKDEAARLSVDLTFAQAKLEKTDHA